MPHIHPIFKITCNGLIWKYANVYNTNEVTAVNTVVHRMWNRKTYRHTDRQTHRQKMCYHLNQLKIS